MSQQCLLQLTIIFNVFANLGFVFIYTCNFCGCVALSLKIDFQLES